MIWYFDNFSCFRFVFFSVSSCLLACNVILFGNLSDAKILLTFVLKLCQFCVSLLKESAIYYNMWHLCYLEYIRFKLLLKQYGKKTKIFSVVFYFHNFDWDRIYALHG